MVGAIPLHLLFIKVLRAITRKKNLIYYLLQKMTSILSSLINREVTNSHKYCTQAALLRSLLNLYFSYSPEFCALDTGTPLFLLNAGLACTLAVPSQAFAVLLNIIASLLLLCFLVLLT